MSSSSSSVGPLTPPPGQVPKRSYSKLIDDYLEEDSDSDDNAPDEEEAGETGLPDFPSTDSTTAGETNDVHGLNTPQAQRVVCTIVDRAARRAKLQPYQLTEASPSVQLGLLFVDVQAMKSEISRVLINQPRFTVDEALHKTICAYSLGVLLSEKLREYKRSSTAIVLTIIRNNNANVPSNLDQDPYAMSVVKAAISDALTQARSRIKKIVGKSIDDNLSIYQLASKVIEGSQCSVSVPLCARLAILRYVYANCGSDLAYWNNVDDCLAQCREKAQGTTGGVQKVLGKMLKFDRSLYGVTDKTSIPVHVSNFQQTIDDGLKI